MADNYLERKMEEYRSGRLGAQRPRLTPTGQRAGTVVLPIERLSVFVEGNCREQIEAFANTGCRVSFCCEDRRTGREIAERTGARYYPFGIREALSQAGEQDVIVRCLTPTTVSLGFSGREPIIVSSDSNVAMLAVVLCSSIFTELTEVTVSPSARN